MQEPIDSIFDIDLFTPELREAVSKGEKAFNPAKLLLATIPVQADEDRVRSDVDTMNRSFIPMVNDNNMYVWEPGALRALFRGDKKPPELGSHPEDYEPEFLMFDAQLSQITRILGPPRDAELEEGFAALRKRPDGRSLGMIHDLLWQISAIVLGTRPLSQEEFEAIVGRLERSARTFGMGSTSRNMATSIDELFGD